MNQAVNRNESRIFESLKQCSSSASQIGRGHWSLPLANGKSFVATARAAEGWLMLDAPVTDRVNREELWDVLRLNATLEGAAKLVLMPDNRSVHVRSDIPLVEQESFESDAQPDDELTHRLLEACEATKDAFRRFRRKNDQASRDEESRDRIDLAEFQLRCAESGWTFVERSAGKLAFDLDTQGRGFHQAIAEPKFSGVRVSVELARWTEFGELNRQALAALLLKAGGLLKLARPSVEESDGKIAAFFEVRFGALPAPVELNHALASLSVACVMCASEARVVEDEVIAREYLAIAMAHAHGRREAMHMAAD